VAIPPEAGNRLLELANARLSRSLSQTQEEEFLSLLQRVNILTAERVVTSYEVTQPEANVSLFEQKAVARSSGQIDSNSVNAFLTSLPAAINRQGNVELTKAPEDAPMRFIVTTTGVNDVNTKEAPVEANPGTSDFRNVTSVIPLTKDHVIFHFTDGSEALYYIARDYIAQKYATRLRPLTLLFRRTKNGSPLQTTVTSVC
jgi:hypothetical protein